MERNARLLHPKGSVWTGIFVLCACFAYLFPGAIFSGKAILPGDILFAYHPWQSEFVERSSKPVNWILFDEVLEFLPWREVVRSNILNGTIPLWDPSAFCGYPFAGLYQNALLYPPDRLTDSLSIRSYTIFRALFHILIAGLGMGLYIRNSGLNKSAITFGTIAFGLCGFMIVWLGHPHVKVAAWLPWLFLGVDLILRRSVRAFPVAAIALTLTLIAGHIETALHTISAAVLYLALSLAGKHHWKHSFKKLRCGSLSLVVSLLIAGAMILPFAEYLSESVAYATRSEGVVTQGWLDPILAVTILMPKFFGSSANSDYWYPGFNSAEIGGVFCGTTTILLALTSLILFWKKPFVFKHAILAAVSGLTVFGVFPFYQITSCLPGFKMSYNFRLGIILSFSAIALASYLLDQFTRDISMAAKRTLSGVSFGLILLCFTTVWRIHSHVDLKPLNTPLHSALAAALILGLATLSIAISGVRKTRFSRIVLIVLMTSELLLFSRGFNPESSADFPEIWPKSIQFLRSIPTNPPFRTLPIGKTYPPHLCALMGIHDVRGNDALTPRVTEDYLACVDPEIINAFSLPALRMMWMQAWESPLIDALNVKYVLFPVVETYLPPNNLDPVRTIGGVHVFSNPRCMSRAFIVNNWQVMKDDENVLECLRSPEVNLAETAYLIGDDIVQSEPFISACATVDLVKYSSHCIELTARNETRSLLVVSDTFFPGWKVLVDDSETTCYRVNHMMRGVFLESGDHRIEFVYRPVSWRLGLFLTLFGCLCFSSGIRMGYFRSAAGRSL